MENPHLENLKLLKYESNKPAGTTKLLFLYSFYSSFSHFIKNLSCFFSFLHFPIFPPSFRSHFFLSLFHSLCFRVEFMPGIHVLILSAFNMQVEMANISSRVEILGVFVLRPSSHFLSLKRYNCETDKISFYIFTTSKTNNY